MHEMLNRALQDFDDNNLAWRELIHAAEFQGVAPLLYTHLQEIDFILPKDQQRTLRSLYQRSRYSAQIRAAAIEEILLHFQKEQIESMVVKGIALVNYVYDQAGLRPMRDIDILVGKAQLQKAERLLVELGYQRKQHHDIPDDYYHLPPLLKIIDGLPVAIELHHDLLPLEESYPRWPLEKSLTRSLSISIGAGEAVTLNLEDSLYYLYLHGFRAPLSYEEYRFVHLADIVSLVEKYFKSIDWDAAAADFPHLLPVLSRLHFVTPWREDILGGLDLDVSTVPKQPGMPYQGWPLCTFKKCSPAELGSLLYRTLMPPQWWMQVYYGHLEGTAYLKSRWFDHPRNIWRWMKAYHRLGKQQ